MSTRPAKLVIFDCDGVLVDSEVISLGVMIEVLTDFGCPLSEKEGYANLLGKSLTANAAWLRNTCEHDLTQEQVAALRTRLFSRFSAELEPICGIEDALDAPTCKACVASSSQPDRIRHSLNVTELLDRFEGRIFSASMVARGKPAPDLFEFAARQMGMSPEDCVVIEDSPAGIEAAKSAGMRVVGFVGGAHAERADLATKVAKAAPNAIITSMEQLPALLAAGV